LPRALNDLHSPAFPAFYLAYKNPDSLVL
jgi:hypothetical protein